MTRSDLDLGCAALLLAAGIALVPSVDDQPMTTMPYPQYEVPMEYVSWHRVKDPGKTPTKPYTCDLYRIEHSWMVRCKAADQYVWLEDRFEHKQEAWNAAARWLLRNTLVMTVEQLRKEQK